MGWKIEDIERLAAQGKIIGYKSTGKETACTAKPLKKKKEPTGLKFIKRELDKDNIPYSTEYRFHDVRRFRFDIALPVLKIAFEYEGVNSAKSRHTSITGYTRDADKYNLAQQLGWRVYRYTALNYKNFQNELKEIFSNETNM